MRPGHAFVLAVVLASGAACLSLSPVPVSVEMPGVSPFPAGLFAEIVVTNFRDDSPAPGFELGRELRAYLAAELARSFKGRVSRLEIPWDEGPAGNDPAFWVRTAAGREAAVFLTGSASLVGRVRKALDKEHRPVDGPFNFARRGLLEQRRWVLTVELSVISATTGELLYKKNFREDQDYIELDKPADFAFGALADRVRLHLFPVLLGTPTIEERTLLRRSAEAALSPTKRTVFHCGPDACPGSFWASF